MASMRAVTSRARVRKAIAESGSPVESIAPGRPREQASWMSNSDATARVPAMSISSGRNSGTSISSTPYSLSQGRNPRAAAGVQAGATARVCTPRIAIVSISLIRKKAVVSEGPAESPAGRECLRRNRALHPSTVKLLSMLISRRRE